jgi:hypothetical protein
VSGHDDWLALTPKMLECLADAKASWFARISPWDYGSSTIGALKRLGYIEGKREMLGGKASTRYAITEAGLKALEGA